MTDERVLVTGGSTIHGLGYEGSAFGLRAAELLKAAEVVDLSAVSLTCREVVENQGDTIVAYAADVAIVMIGGTESLMRPGLRLQELIERYAPQTWHGVAGLEPRARYSRSRWKRVRQSIQSHLKLVLKTVLFRVFRSGTSQLPFPTLAENVTEVLLHVAEHSKQVIAVGLPSVDEKLFPGTAESFRHTNAILRAVSATHPRIRYLSLEGLLDEWDDFLADHLHLARSGHEKVAKSVAELIISAEQPLPT